MTDQLTAAYVIEALIAVLGAAGIGLLAAVGVRYSRRAGE